MIFVNKTCLNTKRVIAAGVAALLFAASSGLAAGYFVADDSAEITALQARINALENSGMASFTVTHRVPFNATYVNTANLEFEDKGYLGVNGDLDRDPDIDGVPIDNVLPETAAAESGLRAGDTILAIDGLRTECFEELRLEIQSRQPGDLALFRIVREGVTFEYLIKLGSWNAHHD